MSAPASLLPVAVVLPLVGAAASPILAKLHRRLPLLLGLVVLGGAAAILVAQATTVYAGTGHVMVHFLSNEKPVHGQALGIAFAADPFGLTYALLTAGLGLVLLLSLLSEFGELGSRELGGLACLTQLLLASLIGIALTGDTVNLFVWYQVAALSSYGLTGFFLERPIALEAAFKMLVMTSIAGFLVFMGSAMFYSGYGALNLAQLHNAVQTNLAHAALGRAGLVALVLLLVGYGTKAGITPFHGWLPDAHTPTPGGISALFSGLMVNLGIVATARMVFDVFGLANGHRLLGLITGLGLVSALLGATMALAQDDLKRVLAWDTVSQMGVLLIGLGSGRADGMAGAVLHMVNHGMFKALLFLCAGSVVHSSGLTKLSELGGLARLRPVTTVAFTVGALSISGVPGFSGYASLALIHEGLQHEPAVFALAVVAQVITIAALARAAWLGFYRPRREPYERMEHQPAGMRISLTVLGIGCVAFGVLPGWIIDHVAGPAAATLLNPDSYAAAVLGTLNRIPPVHVDFSYGKITDLLSTAGELLLGVALAYWYLHRDAEPRAISWLRRLHTGSANDYVAMFASGVLVIAAVVLG